MFEDVKKCYLSELKNKIEDLMREQAELEYELNEYEKKEKEYLSYQTNPLSERRYQYFKEDYPKISKFFNKKKFQKKSRELFNDIQEEYSRKRDDAREIIDENRKKIDSIKKEIDLSFVEVKKIEKYENMKDIQLSFDELKDIMSKHNIDIFKYSCSELIKLGSSEHTTGNLEFMKKAIEESPYNIMYDDTFDYGMYYELISKLEYIPKTNAESENQIKENFLRDKERILYILERSKNNEIFIKPIHLLEGIRFYFKDSYMYEKGSLVDEKERDISSVISNIRNVFDEALLLPEADYLKLQEMYHPEENNYYCHRTGLPGLEDKIFKQGLKVSTQGSGERLIVKNARKVDCLIAIAGYKNFYAGNGQGDTRIILEIPKNCDRPIGSNEMDGKNTYILPTYVMGALSDSELRYDEYYRPIGNTHLHINYHQDKENYKYLFEDGYSINDPSPILNSDYGIESDMGISK